MEMKVKSITNTTKKEEDRDDSVKYMTELVNNDGSIKAVITEVIGRTFQPGDKVELRRVESQSTLDESLPEQGENNDNAVNSDTSGE